MKTQTKIITFLIAVILLLQPLMVTVAYATEGGEPEIEVVTNTELKSITIGDKALYEAIKKQIGNKASYIDSENTIDIYKEDLNSITELKLEESEISDLNGIENFTELVELDVSGNKLTTNSGLDKINSLTKLTYLDLSRNQIEDVSAISSLLNKNGFNLDIDQDIKIIDFVSIIPQPEEYEDAENILINDLKETVDLPQVLLVYENMTINIEEIRADGTKIDKSEFSDYVEIKDGKLRILNRDNNQYEIKLKLVGDLPNHGTICEIKVFRIDTENQEGIVFKDENLYKAIKEKYEYALKIKTKDFAHENYDEWTDIEFISGSENEWTFDNDNLIIVANKKDLREIKNITVSTMHISDLTGIEKFVATETLSFENNKIIDISKIIELNENKKKVIEEFKQKFNEYVEKLSTLVDEYNSLKTQIEAIDKEIEDLRKAIANGQEITDKETTEEKEVRKGKLEISQAKKIAKIQEILAKIEEISNVDGTEGISSLLTSPSIRNEIEEILEEIIESNNNVLEQKEIIEKHKLVDFADRINAILDNLTEKEILELVDEDLNGKPVISDEQLSKAEAKYAIEYMKKHIDQTLDNHVDDLIKDINDLTASEIKATNSDGKQKDAATIRNELKSALNRYYDSKNNIKAENVVGLCIKMTGIKESELLIEVKDTIIPIIKENIASYAKDVSEEIIEDLKSNIVNYIFDLDTMKEENEVIINDKLIPAYNELYGILDTLHVALKTKEYLNDPDDISRIIRRLQGVTDEDINQVIKLPDLTTVRLNRNLISDADKLSEIETLKVLELSYNYISNFDFEKFQNIEQLYLGNNSIKDPEITEMKNITTLDLTNNWIDTISKINLRGMPKLSELDLSYNRITDIQYLIDSTNDYIEDLGYKNVGEYWQDGNAGITIGGQTFGMISENRSDLTDIEIGLPQIFAQMKALETPDFRVTFECTEPLYNVLQDGTKLKVDAEYIHDTRLYGYVYMSAGTMADFALTVAVFYEDDTEAPTISSVEGKSEIFTNSDVTIKVEGATDEVAGLHERPYSFDGGTTWQSSNTKTFTENTENIVIKVRDAEENIYTHEPISITNIDKTAPVVAVNTSVVDAKSGKSNVTITIAENESGLKDDTSYEYCLSTSKEEANGTWTTYVPGEVFTVGEGLEGTYYMFARTVTDKAGNTSAAPEVIKFTFVIPDTTDPTITVVSGMPTEETTEAVTLTIEGAADNVALDEHPYSFDGGESWQKSPSKTYTENTKDIQILVRDINGNAYTHELLEITMIKKENKEENETLEYLTLSGITKLVRAYITDDYSDLPESFMVIAGENGEFELEEITKTIRLYLSL